MGGRAPARSVLLVAFSSLGFQLSLFPSLVFLEVGLPPLFLCLRIFDMTHPLIPKILELARPVADDLDFEIVDATFHTNHNPPTLKISIRNRATEDTSLNDCEAMSLALEAILDQEDVIPDAYVLEISSPGIAKTLTTDREFISFKGFPVVVNTREPFKGKVSLTGQLIRRDHEAVHLNLKGRAIAIPRNIISEVQFAEES